MLDRLTMCALLAPVVTVATLSGAYCEETLPLLSAENSGQVGISGAAMHSSVTGTGDISISTKGASVTSSTALFGLGGGSTSPAKTITSNSGDVSAIGLFTSPEALSDGSLNQLSSFSVQAGGAVTSYSVKTN